MNKEMYPADEQRGFLTAARGQQHPWRVDVLLRKNTSTATTCWKEMMQRRKLVFDNPAVTLQEEEDEQSVGGEFEDDNTIKERREKMDGIDLRNQLQQDLKERLKHVCKDDQVIVETKGLGGCFSPQKQKRKHPDQERSVHRDLMKSIVEELKGISLSSLYTEADTSCDTGDGPSTAAEDAHTSSCSPTTTPQKTPRQQELDSSITAFEAMLAQKQQEIGSWNDHDSVWSEVQEKTNETLPVRTENLPVSMTAAQALRLSSRAGTTRTTTDDDESVWTEYTVQESVVSGAQSTDDTGDNASVWSEYTVQESCKTGAVPSLPSSCLTAAQALRLRQQFITTNDDESVWSEHTVQEKSVVETNSRRTMTTQDARDDASVWTEYTVQEASVRGQQEMATGSLPRSLTAAEALRLNQQGTSGDNDDDESVWTEYTVQESVVDTNKTATQATTETNNGDDASVWTEYTVQEAFGKAEAFPARTESLPRSLTAAEALGLNQQDTADDASVWTEYTLQESVAAPQESSSLEEAPQVLDRSSSTDSNDDYFDCCTGNNNFQGALNNSISKEAEEAAVLESDDCYTEFTVEESITKIPIHRQTSGGLPTQEDDKGWGQDDDSFTLCTVEETVAQEKEAHSFGRTVPKWDDEASYFDAVDNFGLLSDEEQEPGRIHTSLCRTSGTPKTAFGHDSQTATTDNASDEESIEATTNEGSHVSSPEASSRSIAELLRTDLWSRETAVVEAALDVLATEAAEGPRRRFCIARLGGLLAIVRAMEANSEHAGIQVSGCISLEQMSLDQVNQHAIGEVGGVNIIIDAMECHSDDHAVQEAACLALASLTRLGHGATVEAPGAVACLTMAMMRYPEHPQLQEKAFMALANLCVDHQGRLKELSEAGGLVAMTKALSRPWSNHAEKHEAISFLSILLRNLTECDQ